MENKENYEKGKKIELENVKKRLSELKEESKKLLAETQKHFSKDIKIVEDKWKLAMENLDELTSSRGEAWKEVEKKGEKAWEELGVLFKKATHFLKKEGVMVRDDTWEFFQDNVELWRWRRIDPDKRVVGSSHIGYHSKEECIANACRHGYEGN